MVNNVTSLTGNGFKDWVVQRLSAVAIALYSIYLVCFFICHSPVTFEVWQKLFECRAWQVASLLVLAALVLHAWIGIWTVSTDYIKPAALRFLFQVLVIFVLLGTFIWGVGIIWR